MATAITIHDGTNEFGVQRALERAQQRLAVFNEAREVTPVVLEVPPADALIGIDPAVYRQIEAALKSGKRHLLFYGPPGTGKTELARHVAQQVNPASGFEILTGSADWSSQDLIGGYQPMGGGKIAFIPGVLLRNFDKPLIVDELNRCDIDKVLGPLFSVLSKSSTTLPYRMDVADPDSRQFVILGEFDPDAETPPVYSPHNSWRLIATINTMDKAGLFRMSYALSRRFAWIFVDVPTDLDAFVGSFLSRQGGAPVIAPADGFAISKMWRSVNKLRPLGAAPFIDMINHCRAVESQFDFRVSPVAAAQVDAYLDAFRVHVMPMLDGLMKIDLRSLAVDVMKALELQDGDARRSAFESQLGAFGL
jgi:MoxR-like ATPase